MMFDVCVVPTVQRYNADVWFVHDVSKSDGGACIIRSDISACADRSINDATLLVCRINIMS